MSLHKQYTVTTITRHFAEYPNKTHQVIHSKQICDRELVRMKQTYAVVTKKQGDIVFHIICKTHVVR